MCPSRLRNAIFLFMDAFQGYYKNGTDGTRDMRSASGIGFVLRFMVYLSLSYMWSRSFGANTFLVAVGLILRAASLIYANFRPCKKWYM